MSEKLSGESFEGDIPDRDIEQAIDLYLAEIGYEVQRELELKDISEIMSRLIENGPDLDPLYRDALRERIALLLGRRGLRVQEK